MQEVRFSGMPQSEWRPDDLMVDPSVVFIAIGQAKNEEKLKTGEGAMLASSFAGIVAHTIIEHEGDSPEEFETNWHRLYEHRPAVIQLWSLAVYEALDKFRALRPTPEGHETKTLNEIRLGQPHHSLEAGKRLEGSLISERAAGLIDGPVAKVLRAFHREDGYSIVDDNVARLIEELKPFLPYGIEDDLLDTSTHTLGLDGKLIWLPTIRGDAFRMTYKADDERVKMTAAAFSQLLKSGQAHDRDYLARQQIDFASDEGTDLKDGYDIIHDVVEMMMDGRLLLEVDEYKTKTMLGKQYRKCNPVWKYHKQNVREILDYLPDNSDSPEYKPWQAMLESDELDMAKTANAMLTVLTNGLRQYYLKTGVAIDHEVITKNNLATKLKGNVIWIGLDIRQGGSAKYQLIDRVDDAPYNKLVTRAGKEYRLLPDISRVGVPDKVTFGKYTVSGKHMMDLISQWETTIFDNNVKRYAREAGRIIMGRPLHKSMSTKHHF